MEVKTIHHYSPQSFWESVLGRLTENDWPWPEPCCWHSPSPGWFLRTHQPRRTGQCGGWSGMNFKMKIFQNWFLENTSPCLDCKTTVDGGGSAVARFQEVVGTFVGLHQQSGPVGVHLIEKYFHSLSFEKLQDSHKDTMFSGNTWILLKEY